MHRQTSESNNKFVENFLSFDDEFSRATSKAEIEKDVVLIIQKS